MKSLIALSAAFAFISVFAFAKWVRSPSDAPSVLPTATAEVHFLEQELQLGTVRLNEQIGGSLTILNDTDQPVVLCEPFKSCSCTEASLDRRTLAPRDRCSLTVAVQTGNRRGKRAEAVSVVCTAPDGSNARQLVGRVLFEVKGVFEVEPGQVSLTRAEPRAVRHGYFRDFKAEQPSPCQHLGIHEEAA